MLIPKRRLLVDLGALNQLLRPCVVDIEGKCPDQEEGLHEIPGAGFLVFKGGGLLASASGPAQYGASCMQGFKLLVQASCVALLLASYWVASSGDAYRRIEIRSQTFRAWPASNPQTKERRNASIAAAMFQLFGVYSMSPKLRYEACYDTQLQGCALVVQDVHTSVYLPILKGSCPASGTYEPDRTARRVCQSPPLPLSLSLSLPLSLCVYIKYDNHIYIYICMYMFVHISQKHSPRILRALMGQEVSQRVQFSAILELSLNNHSTYYGMWANSVMALQPDPPGVCVCSVYMCIFTHMYMYRSIYIYMYTY